MSKKESWGSRVGLILAMAGNAVGLGNFLRFPAQAVANGGGTFIIPYLVSFLLMGIPLLWVEWSMGRFGGRFGDHSTPFILDNLGKKKIWKYIGVFGIFTNLGVISYYTYIESWTLTYMIESVTGAFSGMDQAAVAGHFDSYVDINASGINFPKLAIGAFLVTLAFNIWILSKGISGGIEKIAKVAMPMLIIFGAFLAIKAFTIGDTGACATCDSMLGFNYLWEPQFSSLLDPTVWLAAAGQIFFTVSVGMGTIHCYASYLKKNDDIALNAMSAGWMNEFVEVVLGASVVIPISVGYLGLDWVQENAGFMMAFKTMPFLFDKWGPVFSELAGFFWFGLLFFAGVTSSLAMGTPFMGFMQDEFKWTRKKSAVVLGFIVLVMATPTIIFFQQGVFDEYDYWTGTVSLVIFAFLEVILFAYVFGIDKGWDEVNRGADIKVPTFFKYVTKWVTPVFTGTILLFSFYPFLSSQDANSTILYKLMNADIKDELKLIEDYKELPNSTEATVYDINEFMEYLNSKRGIDSTLFGFDGNAKRTGDHASALPAMVKSEELVYAPNGFLLWKPIPSDKEDSIATMKARMAAIKEVNKRLNELDENIPDTLLNETIILPQINNYLDNIYAGGSVINPKQDTLAEPLIDEGLVDVVNLFQGRNFTSLKQLSDYNPELEIYSKQLKKKKVFVNGSRLLLLVIFILIALMVRIAYLRREKLKTA